MSHLLFLDGTRVNRRAAGRSGNPSQSSEGQRNTSDSGNRKEMKMDEKWISSITRLLAFQSYLAAKFMHK